MTKRSGEEMGYISFLGELEPDGDQLKCNECGELIITTAYAVADEDGNECWLCEADIFDAIAAHKLIVVPGVSLDSRLQKALSKASSEGKAGIKN